MKKTPEQIKKEILDKLEQGPLSIQQISKDIDSNWVTVSKFLDELKNELRVREILIGDNVRLFRLVREDTYLDIPVDKKYKELGYYIFKKIREEWKTKKDVTPTNTDVLKVAVEVLEKTELNQQIPTVWYLYGKIPVLKLLQEPQLENVEHSTIKVKNVDIGKLDNQIESAVKTFSDRNNSHEIRVKQYELYNQELYILKEKLFHFLVKEEVDSEKLKSFCSELYARCPSKEDASEILNITQDFVSTIYKMSMLKNLNELKKEVLETLYSVWKMIAVYMFFDSLTSYDRFKERDKILSIYFSDSLFRNISNAKESVANLNSIYMNNISQLEEPKLLEDNPTSKLLGDIIFEMSSEGTKEDDKSIS
jgi:hypothetical protein